MIHYTFDKLKYYKDNREIDFKQLKKELSKDRIEKLKTTGKCNIRKTSIAKGVKLSKNEKTILREQQLNEKLYQARKADYRVEYTTYPKSGRKIELWRKNKRYGYFNFVAYLVNDSEENIKNIVLKDIKEQDSIKTKRN